MLASLGARIKWVEGNEGVDVVFGYVFDMSPSDV